MLKKLLLATTIIFSSSMLVAEGNSTKEATPKKVETKASNSDNLDVAYKLLEQMNLKKIYDNAVEGATQRLVNANKNFKPIESKIKGFYQKYIGWDSVKKDLAKLYSKYYTKSELEDITNFYKTKTGQKVLATMGKVAREGQTITQNRLRPHLKELKAILDKANFKNKKDGEKKDEKK